jgi:hypothetical protein
MACHEPAGKKSAIRLKKTILAPINLMKHQVFLDYGQYSFSQPHKLQLFPPETARCAVAGANRAGQ